jgi:alkane 1-monooxygenase
MKPWSYSATFIFVPLVACSIWLGGWWAYATPLVAFGLLPLLELFWKGSLENLDETSEAQAKEERTYSLLLYVISFAHIGLVLSFFVRLKMGDISTTHLIGMLWSVGIACGAYGINVAHELGHRKNKWEQRLAKMLLSTALYMHFFIEHNRGHHARVATEEDPASARYGETVYGFWLRSIRDGYLSAWEIENTRLQKKNIPWWSWQNEMLRMQLIQLSALVGLGLWGGWQVVAGYMVVAATGVLLLETINYLEHYGLQRKKKDNGRYETVQHIHSWNSNHPLGRIMLFELTRHSDHHAHASRKYQILRHFDDSPQLPTGYPGMMILSLFPPLWFAVMHKRLDQYHHAMDQKVPLHAPA